MTKRKVYDTICQHGEIALDEICKLCDISESTARRSIVSLATEGLVERYYGGARAIFRNEPPIVLRTANCIQEKQLIAKKACELIKHFDPIMLVNGSTVNLMATYLKDNSSTIITNSITILNKLVASKNQIIMLGGAADKQELCLSGSLNEICLRELRIGTLFFSVTGIDPEYGITGAELEQVQFYRSLFARSQRSILLVDHSKFSQVGSCLLAPLHCIDTIVTDSLSPPDKLDALREKGINIIVV